MQAAAILPSIPTVQAPPPPPDEPVADANGFADVMDQTDVAPAPETVGDPPTETAPDGLPSEGEAPTTPGTPVIGQPPPYWPALPAPLLALLPEAAAVPTAPPLVAGPEGGVTDALIPDAPQSPSAQNADPRIVAQPGLSGLAPSGPTGAPDTGSVIAAAPPDTSELRSGHQPAGTTATRGAARRWSAHCSSAGTDPRLLVTASGGPRRPIR